jgi:hypothetical protein
MLFDCNCRVNYWVQLGHCAGAGSAAEVEVCISVSSQSVASEAELSAAARAPPIGKGPEVRLPVSRG